MAKCIHFIDLRKPCDQCEREADEDGGRQISIETAEVLRHLGMLDDYEEPEGAVLWLRSQSSGDE